MYIYKPDFNLISCTVGFQPDAEKSTVHHMMVVGCDSPVDIERGEPNLWNCGGSLGLFLSLSQ